MRTSSAITPILFVLGAIIVLYYLMKNRSASNPYSAYNPYAPNPLGPSGPGGVSTFNTGLPFNDFFGPGPNMSSGAVGNGGAVDPAVNTNADFNGSESDPEAGLY